MVDHAAQYGIQLEATSRLQRGHINYPPTDGEWRRAQEKAAETGTAFEAPLGKPRVAEALNRATEEIRNWSLRYRDLASYASQGNWQDLASAFEKASAVLAEGGAIVAKADPYVSIAEGFDKAIGLKRAVDDAEVRIADAAPNQRPAMERKLSEALAAIEHLQPLGRQSRGLSDAASEDGIYSPQNLAEVNTHLALLGRDPLRAALDGTGIDPMEVEARMRATATSAALETRWVQQDLQSVADLRGLDLRDAAQLRQAIAVVDRAYDRVAADYGVDDAIYQRAAAQRGAAVERSEGDQETTRQIERARDTAALERASVTSHRSRGGTSADHSDLRRYARPVGVEDERLLRQAVERSLTRAELAALKAGDAEVLRGVGDREDQLTLARDYLRASNDPALQQGIHRVSADLSAERDRVRQERGHEEGGHGSG
jgi:type IV secretion system T-DNA border endonuclease VirD2